jgi:hypothetical protein
MQPIDLARTCAALACTLAVCGTAAAQQAHDDSVVAPAVAQKQHREISQGDPARWYQQPATLDARMRNLQKEIGAAYAEAKKACAEQPKAERPACLKDAHTAYDQDMANARDTLANRPQAEVRTIQK